jgi:hypothetical protein
MVTYPSHEYRQYMRYAAHTLSTPTEEALLMGKPVNKLSMDELEAYCDLMFGKPLSPPADYTSRRS